MPALLLELEDEYKSFYRDMNDWEKYDPLYIAKHNDISSEMKVYLDAGEKDEGRFYEGGSILHNMLKKKRSKYSKLPVSGTSQYGICTIQC